MDRLDTLVQRLLLFGFLASTPVCTYFVYARGGEREWWAVANSYGFSVPMSLLYVWPLLSPFRSSARRRSVEARLHDATTNWVLWLTCLTELVFQIPHNVFVSALEARKGSLVEWPFYSYGLSDSRWSSYSIALKNEGGSAVGSNSSQKAGLDPAVWLINANDASLGFLVLYAWVLMQAQTKTQVAREKKGEDVAAAAKKEKKGREGEKQQQPQSAWQAVRRWLQQLKLLPTVGTPGLTSVLTSVDWELACALLLVFRDGTLFRE